MREARKAAQAQDQRARPANETGPKAAGSRGPKGSEAEKPKQTPRKEKQRQAEPKATEEDRLRRQKAAEELAARRKAAADEERRRKDEEARKARETNRLQERIVLIQGLPPSTELVDVLEPLVDLAPGPVFDSKLWSARVASVEFCTGAAARKVLGLAQQGGLYVKGTKVTARLALSKNKIPVVGSVSRVVVVRGPISPDLRIGDEDVVDFLTRQGLQVDRFVSLLGTPGTSVRLASWADAEKATELLQRHLPPRARISYGPDPCATRQTVLHLNVGYLLTSFGFTNTERTRE